MSIARLEKGLNQIKFDTNYFPLKEKIDVLTLLVTSLIAKSLEI